MIAAVSNRGESTSVSKPVLPFILHISSMMNLVKGMLLRWVTFSYFADSNLDVRIDPAVFRQYGINMVQLVTYG